MSLEKENNDLKKENQDLKKLVGDEVDRGIEEVKEEESSPAVPVPPSTR